MATPGVDGENGTKTLQMPVVVTSSGAAICSRPQAPKAESVLQIASQMEAGGCMDGWTDGRTSVYGSRLETPNSPGNLPKALSSLLWWLSLLKGAG